MKKTKRIIHWRLNVLVLYHDQTIAKSYRVDILELLRHLSSIYRLDYAVSEEHQFSCESDSLEQSVDTSIVDLVYFRSNESSRLDRKMLRSIIDSMFHTGLALFDAGVDVCTQFYKALPEFPFPSEFCRPLNYPYVEYHEGSQKTLCILADEVMKVIEKEQDFLLN